MAIRSRLEISSWLILEGLRSNFNRAFSISRPSDGGQGLRELGTCNSGLDRMRDAERKIAKNLRLGIFSSLILMGLTRNSNSRFAIRTRPFDSRWSLRMPMLDASAFAIRIAEMRWVADGGCRVELPLIRTTDVTLLVTICQGRRAGRPANRLRAAKSIPVTTLRRIDSEPDFLISPHLEG